MCGICCFSFGCADNAFHDWIIQVHSHMRLSFIVVLIVIVAAVVFVGCCCGCVFNLNYVLLQWACDFHDGVARVVCRLCWSCDLVCSDACLVS